MPSHEASSGASSPLRMAANRRNALKSTGPRTAAGKRRAALNSLNTSLCPEDLQRELRSRGEDPREFRRLCRDLMAIFQPRDRTEAAGVALLALTWWEKARRTRNWVAAGPVRVDDLDARLEELLNVLVLIQRTRHQWWRDRLASILGRAPATPAELRCAIEARLFVFGAKPGRRSYPRRHRRTEMLKDFEEFRSVVANLWKPGEGSQDGGQGESKR